MKVAVSLTFDSASEAIESLSKMTGLMFIPEGHKLVPITSEDIVVTVDSAPAPENAAAPAPVIEVTSDAPEPARTLADVIKAVQDLSARRDLPAVRELLTAFGATRVKDLKPEQFNSFIVAAQAK